MIPNIENYSIGWICALQVEYEAACRMLDEELEGPETNQVNDYNTYICGKIGPHNIVIGCLPNGRYGLSQATTVAKDMVRSFPYLKFALMVGIGGGAPTSENDIRLGDVVVSVPRGANGGVFQYDLGKTLEKDRFEHTGHQNSPPALLLSAVSELQRLHNDPRKPDKVAKNLNRMQDMVSFKVPRNDDLYHSDYIHRGGEGCSDCNSAAICDRGARDNIRRVTIHYGTIASGNTVMKNAAVRDKYANDPGLKIMCFEMEAAGLMNQFPCLVIRGICDYSDSHKNNEWHPYAALAAAAYARSLLHVVKPMRVISMPPWVENIGKVLNQIKEQVSSMSGATDRINKHNQTQSRSELLNWITHLNYDAQQSDSFERSCSGTGQWFLSSDVYQTWQATRQQTLFCPGNPGVGKTILASIIINELLCRFKDDESVGVAYIYCSFLRLQEQKPVDYLACLLKQLCSGSSYLPEPIIALYNKHKTRKTRPDLEEISETLSSVMNDFSKVFIVIDALDEYQASDGRRSKFLSALLELQKKAPINLLVTSRPNPAIKQRMEGTFIMEVHAQDIDLRRYLQERILHGESGILRRTDVQRNVIEGIIKAVNGMFLLAKLQLDSLLDMRLPRDVKEALKTLPSGSEAYDCAYEDAMNRINCQGPNSVQFAKRVLSWIIFARRELSPRELQHAVSVQNGDQEIIQDDLPDTDDILSVCCGLVTVDEQSNVVRLIHYTTQDYFQRTCMRWFPYAESDLANTCITYLSFGTFQRRVCKTTVEFEDRLQNYTLYLYAANFWGVHARKSSDLGARIVNFLESAANVSSALQAMEIMEFPWTKDGGGPTTIYMPGLHLAAYFGISEVIAELLTSAPIDLVDWAGRTALWWAATSGHEQLVSLLLNRKANANIRDRGGLAPLWLASYRGHVNIAEMLIERGQARDIGYGQSTLCLALERGYLNVAKLLVDEDPGIGSDYQYPYRRPLLLAAEGGHLELVKHILEKGVYIESKDGDSRTPLSLAAGSGHEEIAQLLLNLGAEVNSRDCRDRMPLWYAISNEHHALAEILLDAGANVEKTLALASSHNLRQRNVKLRYEPWFEDEEVKSQPPIQRFIQQPITVRMGDREDDLVEKDRYEPWFEYEEDRSQSPIQPFIDQPITVLMEDQEDDLVEKDRSVEKSPEGWYSLMYGY